MTPAAQTHARALLPNEGPAMQAALAAYLDEAAQDWIAAEAPWVRIEQVGAVDERFAQRNDARRKELAA